MLVKAPWFRVHSTPHFRGLFSAIVLLFFCKLKSHFSCSGELSRVFSELLKLLPGASNLGGLGEHFEAQGLHTPPVTMSLSVHP